MNVSDIMTSDPRCCTPETSLQQVASIMAECDCGAVPVVDDVDSNTVVGVVTDRDIAVRIVAEGRDCGQATARDAMTSSVTTVSAGDSVKEAESMMKDRQVRRLIVVDEQNCCVGIVAQADIARHRSDRATGDVVEEISEPAAVH